jgi:hypothetical protein
MPFIHSAAGEVVAPELSDFQGSTSPKHATSSSSSFTQPADELLSADTTLTPLPGTLLSPPPLAAPAAGDAATPHGVLAREVVTRCDTSFYRSSSSRSSGSSKKAHLLQDLGSKQPLQLLSSLSDVVGAWRTAGVLRERVGVLEQQLGMQQQLLDGLRAHQRDSEVELRLQVCVGLVRGVGRGRR